MPFPEFSLLGIEFVLSRSLISMSIDSNVFFFGCLRDLLDIPCQFGSLVLHIAAPFFSIVSCDVIFDSDALLVIKLLMHRELIFWFTMNI